MNNINFTAKNSFPLSTAVMGFLQDMVKLNADFAALGGTNYILAGCADDGSGNVSAGSIVINGEILPFEAGKKKAKITVHQKPKTLTAFGVDYPEALINRTAKFSDTGEYNWGDFARVETLLQLTTRLNQMITIPKGIIAMWSGNVNELPSGWALCNGLNGSPNLSGKFIVGFDMQDESYNEIGKKGGQKEVTLEARHLPAHNHRAVTDGVFNMLSARAADVDASNTPGSIDSVTADKEYRVGGMTPGQWTQAEIKTVGEDKPYENRPPYYVLAYIIKL